MENITAAPVAPEKNKEEVLRESMEISSAIEQKYTEFINQISMLLEKNETFRKALMKYSGMELFKDGFKFQCYNTAAAGLGKENLFSNGMSTLGRYFEANKDRTISLAELQAIQTNFEARTEQIVDAIFGGFTNPETAADEISRIHKELVMPPLNSEKVFS